MRAVSRGADELIINTDVVVMRDGAAWVGRIGEMAQIVQRTPAGSVRSVVRMWVRMCRAAASVDGELEVRLCEKAVAMLVIFESAEVHAVTHVSDCLARDVQRYRV